MLLKEIYFAQVFSLDCYGSCLFEEFDLGFDGKSLSMAILNRILKLHFLPPPFALRQAIPRQL